MVTFFVLSHGQDAEPTIRALRQPAFVRSAVVAANSGLTRRGRGKFVVIAHVKPAPARPHATLTGAFHV